MLALVLGLALKEGDPDYSMLYAVSDWAVRLLGSSDSALEDIRETIQSLNDAVCLTSGWELTNVWELLFTQKWTPEAYKVQQLIESMSFDSCTSSDIRSLSGKHDNLVL